MLSTLLKIWFRNRVAGRQEFDNGQFVSDVNDMIVSTPGVAYAEESGDTRTVTIQIKDWKGNALEQRVPVEWIMTDAAGGAPASSAPSGGVSVSTGTPLIEFTANKYGKAITDENGVLVLSVIEETAKNFYLTLKIRGKLFNLPVLAFEVSSSSSESSSS